MSLRRAVRLRHSRRRRNSVRCARRSRGSRRCVRLADFVGASRSAPRNLTHLGTAQLLHMFLEEKENNVENDGRITWIMVLRKPHGPLQRISSY